MKKRTRRWSWRLRLEGEGPDRCLSILFFSTKVVGIQPASVGLRLLPAHLASVAVAAPKPDEVIRCPVAAASAA